MNLSGSLLTNGAGAFGVQLFDNNRIDLSGSIDTTSGGAIGLAARDNNDITISGRITTLGTGSPGVLLRDNNQFSLSGNIATSGLNAPGIVFEFDNMIDVSGAITTTDANADGLIGINDNTINISGSITTQGTDSDGIEVNDGNRVTNSGVIKTAGDGSADAIEVDDNNIIVNSGTLMAAGDTLANGIDGESSNQIFNSGTVISSQGAGIDLTSGASGSFISNSGFIGGNGISIDFGPGNDSLQIANGSILNGLVDFDTGTSSIFFVSGNQTVTSTGTLPAVAAANDIFLVQNGATVTSLDQDLLGFSELTYAFLDQSHHIHQMISGHAEAGAAPQKTVRTREIRVASSNSSVLSAPRRDRAVWASLYGGFAEREAEGQIPDSEHRFWGALVGTPVIANDQASLGFFGGYGNSRIDSNEERTTGEIDRFFGGVYGGLSAGPWAMTATIFSGLGRTDSVRNIANNAQPGGLDAARAEIDSLFVGAGIETSWLFEGVVGDVGLRPAGGVRYAGEWSDGYTESGTFAALTVEDRTVHAMSGFAELALVATHRQVQLDIGLGAEGRTVFGDGSVNVALLATPFTVTPADNDGTVDGYARLGLKGNVTDRLSLFLDLEGRTGSDVDVGASARTGVNFTL